MITPDGNMQMLNSLEPDELHRAAAQLDVDVHDALVVAGTEDQIRALAGKVRLGASEQARRRNRRDQQKASRRANR